MYVYLYLFLFSLSSSAHFELNFLFRDSRPNTVTFAGVGEAATFAQLSKVATVSTTTQALLTV